MRKSHIRTYRISDLGTQVKSGEMTLSQARKISKKMGKDSKIEVRKLTKWFELK